jgi:seryl-tRNA synthetase
MAYQKTSADQKTKSTQGAGGDPVSVSLQRSSSTMGKLGSVNEDKNLFATGIRETDKALQEVSTVTVKMKERLETIVKNFPPFPVDSAERKDLLMSYVSLRKEIEKLTFPKPPAPVYENNQKLWEKIDFSDTRKVAEALPVLDETSSDSQVRRAVGSLDELQTSLCEGRKELFRTITE